MAGKRFGAAKSAMTAWRPPMVVPVIMAQSACTPARPSLSPVGSGDIPPARHHRLFVEATCLLDGQSALPLNAYSHLNVQTTNLAYIRIAHLWKEIDFEVLPHYADG